MYIRFLSCLYMYSYPLLACPNRARKKTIKDDFSLFYSPLNFVVHFCRAMLCICAPAWPMPSCGVCLSVRPSVTFVDYVKTNKRIFEIFPLSGSHTILVFPYQTGWRYFDGPPPLNGGVECRWGRQKRDSGRISGFAAYRSTLSTVRVGKCEKQSRDERWQASSTHRSVRRPLFAQDDDEVFVTGSTLYAGDEGRSTPLLVITPVFCCRRTS